MSKQPASGKLTGDRCPICNAPIVVYIVSALHFTKELDFPRKENGLIDFDAIAWVFEFVCEKGHPQ